jgi:hypothetical protein
MLRKSKGKKEQTEKEIDIPIAQETDDAKNDTTPILDTGEDNENQPITEYQETLYSSETTPKKKKDTYKQKSWERSTTIENNVDSLNQNAHVQKKTYSISDDIDKKVDNVLSQKGIKISSKKKKQESITAPEGYELKVNKRTGLSYFKKK